MIATTNRDLTALVREGRFREDLYYRIRVVPITLTALRERREDIPLLVDHFVKRFAVKTGKTIRELSAPALRALLSYDFPGNVRELENIIERAFVMCHGPRIELSHLAAEVTASAALSEVRVKGPNAAASMPASRPQIDPAAAELLSVLQAHCWRRAEAARVLGIGRNTLWRRMKRLGLMPPTPPD